MKIYRCDSSFKAKSGMIFHQGANIDMGVYVTLHSEEKKNFTEMEENKYQEDYRSDDVVDDVIGIASAIAVDSVSDDMFDRPSSSDSASDNGPSFDGFGGGDMGGGGSSGDW